MSDFDETFSSAASAASNAFQYLTALQGGLLKQAPLEADAARNLLDQVQHGELSDLAFNAEVPFLWTKSVEQAKRLELTCMLNHFLRANSCFWDEITTPSRPTRLHSNLPFASSSNLLSQTIALTYKNEQPTGAHITVNRLKHLHPGFGTLDVRGRSSEEVLRDCRGCTCLILNSLQIPLLWKEFDSFLASLTSFPRQTCLAVYFHETPETIVRFLSSTAGHALLSAGINGCALRLLFVSPSQMSDVFRRIPHLRKNVHACVGNLLAEEFMIPEDPKDSFGHLQSAQQTSNYITIIGSIQERKGFSYVKTLANALSSLQQNLRILWLGFPNAYRATEWTDMPTNLHFMGPVSGWHKYNVLKGSRCLLVPSEEEPFSFAAAEAIVSGVPCAYRPGRCGLLDAIRERFGGHACISLSEDATQAANTLIDSSLCVTPSTEVVVEYIRNIMSPDRFSLALRRVLASSIHGEVACSLLSSAASPHPHSVVYPHGPSKRIPLTWGPIFAS